MRKIPLLLTASGINADRFWSKVAPPNENGCRLWVASKRNGYGVFRVTTRTHGRRFVVNAHRAAYALAHGSAPHDKLVIHSCDVAACCAPEHLRLGTYAENTRDIFERNRSSRAKLISLKAARIVRKLHGQGWSGAAIGRMFGVTKSVISRAICGKTWKEIR